MYSPRLIPRRWAAPTRNTLKFDLNIDGTNAKNSDDKFKEEWNWLREHFRQSKSEPDFWVVWVTGAFQGPLQRDLDHLGDDGKFHPLFGTSWGDLLTGGRAILFCEVAVDIYGTSNAPRLPVDDFWELILAHELGHQFGLADNIEDGKLMDMESIFGAGIDFEKQLRFSGSGLLKIVRNQDPRGRTQPAELGW